MAAARVLELSSADPRRAAFLARALSGLATVLPSVPPRVLDEAAAQETDYGALVAVLQRPEALAAWQQADPFAAARQRAVQLKTQILEAEGGAETTAEVANRLGVSRQAVDKRRRARQLLAVDTVRGHLYPRWQFDGSVALSGLASILADLTAETWEAASWFLAPNPRLQDRRPLDVLRVRQGDKVRAAARAYGEQGAA